MRPRADSRVNYVKIRLVFAPQIVPYMPSDRSDDLHYLWWLALAAAICVLLYLLGPMLTPFLLAAMLAYIFNPLAERLARRVPRGLAATIVLLLVAAAFVLLLLILLPLLVRQVRAIMEQVPAHVDWLKTVAAPWIESRFGVQVDVGFIREWIVSHAAEIQAFAMKLLPTITSGGLAVVGFLVNLVLVPVVLFYFIRDWNRIVAAVDGMIPRPWRERVVGILREIDDVLGEFLRGQLTVMLFMAMYYALALWIAGLDFALSVGLVAGLVTFVPYLGVVIGVSLATLTGALQFSDWTQLVWVWLVFGIGNLLEGYVFVPWLVGDRIGLHPVAVIFALLAFAQLFGFFGVLLALPASAALLVWLRHVRGTYFASSVYKG